jgi:hypothetical protein
MIAPQEGPWGRADGEEEKSKGRSRKPLAEVIFKSAPLRATSSGGVGSISRASPKSMKLKGRGTHQTGRNCPARERFTLVPFRENFPRKIFAESALKIQPDGVTE